jgi:predicted O-methyltransferase YrrM
MLPDDRKHQGECAGGAGKTARPTRFYQFPRLWFTLPRRIRNLREQGTVQDWVDFAFSSPFSPLQVRAEISAFMETVAARRPKTALEIGTEWGGTLLLLTLAAAPDATVISIDMPTGRFGGYPRWRGAYYHRFALPSQRLHLLRANSHLLSTVQSVRAILADRPLDVLLIDGDHTYGGAKADWGMYGPLVAPDALVAFHDIVVHPPKTQCEVHTLWQELKAAFAHQEIVADRAQSWGGIGLIWPGRNRRG